MSKSSVASEGTSISGAFLFSLFPFSPYVFVLVLGQCIDYTYLTHSWMNCFSVEVTFSLYMN